MKPRWSFGESEDLGIIGSGTNLKFEICHHIYSQQMDLSGPFVGSRLSLVITSTVLAVVALIWIISVCLSLFVYSYRYTSMIS